MKRFRKRLVSGGLALLALALLVPVLVSQFPARSLLFETILEFGHVPLFGLISLCLLAFSLVLWGESFRNRWTHYLLALAGTCTLTIVSELVQFYGPRDASIMDLVRDLVGGVTALALASALDTKLQQESAYVTLKWVRILQLCSVLLVILFLIPLALAFEAYRQRNLNFPSICRFEEAWERKFVTAKDARVKFVPAPAARNGAGGDRAGRVRFFPARYPALILDEPVPDWRDFEFFVFEIYSELETEIKLYLRIDDRWHDQSYEDRFNYHFTAPPGNSSVRVPLLDVKAAPQAREMDMAEIYTIVIFAHEPDSPFILWFDNMRLE